MLIRRRRANLIDMYWSTLRSQRIPEPPAGLDDETARLIATLDQHLAPPDASDAFVDRLWQDLEPAPEATDSRRAWSGPAIDPVQQRRTRTRPVKESEERVIMSDITTTQPEPTTLPERRWTRELLKIAAAIAIFAVIGIVLALILRDDDDDPVIMQPGPTATPAASATLVPTQAIVATATFAEPTTAPEVTATAPAPTATPPEPTVTAPSTVIPDLPAIIPTAVEVVANIDVGSRPYTWMAAAAGSIWVANGDSGTVSRIDPATNQVVATIVIAPGPSGGEGSPDGVVTLGDQIWVSSTASSSLVRIDPATNQIVETIEILDLDPFQLRGMAAGAGSIWLSNPDMGLVIRVDPATGETVSIRVSGAGGIAATDNAVWVTDSFSRGNRIFRIDPATNEVVETVFLGNETRPTQIAVGFGSVWVASQGRAIVLRIDPVTNEVIATVSEFTLNGEPALQLSLHAIAVDAHGVWVGDNMSGGLYLIDPATNQEAASLPTAPFDGIVVGDGSVWLASFLDAEVVRISPAE